MEQQITAVFGTVALLLIGVIGYLLDQRNKQVNDTLKELQMSMIEVRADMKGIAHTHVFIKDRLTAVEQEMGTFRNRLYSIDLTLARMDRASNFERFPRSEPPQSTL